MKISIFPCIFLKIILFRVINVSENMRKMEELKHRNFDLWGKVFKNSDRYLVKIIKGAQKVTKSH